jgi:hypothetical protein
MSILCVLYICIPTFPHLDLRGTKTNPGFVSQYCNVSPLLLLFCPSLLNSSPNMVTLPSLLSAAGNRGRHIVYNDLYKYLLQYAHSDEAQAIINSTCKVKRDSVQYMAISKNLTEVLFFTYSAFTNQFIQNNLISTSQNLTTVGHLYITFSQLKFSLI